MPERADYPDGRAYNEAVAAEFRANGKLLTGDFAGRDLLLLTTIGAKSGKPHTTPLGFTLLNDRVMVSAGAGGQANNPAWYHNLVANPEVTVEMPGRTFQARATPTAGEEREAIAAERIKTNAGARAGVRLSPRRLTPRRLLDAVRAARECREGARRVSRAYAQAGGQVAAADAIEALGQADRSWRPFGPGQRDSPYPE